MGCGKMERLARLCLFFQLAGGLRNVERTYIARMLGVDKETFEKVYQAAKRVVDDLVEKVLQEVREDG